MRSAPGDSGEGSVGASGDLAPLAHLALVVVGEGEAFYRGERIAGGEALRRAGLNPLQLTAKEGLALLNGTQAMTAVGALAIASTACCRSFAIFRSNVARSTQGNASGIRRTDSSGQAACRTDRVRGAFAAAHGGIEIRESHREHDTRVQDAYCLRCMPQVHGAVRGVLAHVAVYWKQRQVRQQTIRWCFRANGRRRCGDFRREFSRSATVVCVRLCSAGDNGSGGITERRVDRLLNPDINEGLPAFLSTDPGLSSGFMIAQIVAAALINECQVLRILVNGEHSDGRRQGRSCVDGDDGRNQVAADRGTRGTNPGGLN